MSKDQENQKTVIQYWLEKPRECLASAGDEVKADRLSFAVNRIYYACFYAATAVLLRKRLRFKKHAGVRALFHQHLVKPGLISTTGGELYDELFDTRLQADYLEFTSFQRGTVEKWLEGARELRAALSALAIGLET